MFFCEFQSIKNHIHHKIYKKGLMAWEYDNNDLIIVCNDCHRKIHNSLIQYKRTESIKIVNIIYNYFNKIFNE